MKPLFRSAVVAAAVALATAVGANAALAATVKVALLDVTALGRDVMGPVAGIGMMGRGGFGEPGMMGAGSGLGGGMTGPGMMGPGMMSIRVDHPSVKAGSVSFDVVNWSRSLVHEMLVVAVDSPDARLPYDFAKQQVLENQVKVLGETAELEPGESKTIDLTLPAGDYLLICNVPGHYGAGMQTTFTVTE